MTWNKTKPTDSESFGSLGGVIRDNWDALEDNIKVDHYEMEESLDGQHRKVTLPKIATPADIADTGIAYAKEVNDITELHYVDSAGTEVQVTSNGSIGSDKSFEIIGINDSKDGAINGASGQDIYIITGDNVGANKVSFMNSSETITAATANNPCQITAVAHGMATGDVTRLVDIAGMVELNNANYTITKVDDDNFTLDSTDSSLYTAYTSDGRFCEEITSINSIEMNGRASINSNGAIIASSGNIASCARTGVGSYVISFKVAYDSANGYAVATTLVLGAARVRLPIVWSRTTSAVQIAIATTENNTIDGVFDITITKI